MNRKDFLIGASLLTANAIAGENHSKKLPESVKKLRIAHITDCHVFDKKYAIESMQKAVSYINNLAEPIDFIINTGDSIMDSLGKSRDKVAAQWQVWHSVTKDFAAPIYHAIGNHDVWGWSNPLVGRQQEGYGKAWAVNELKLKNRFYDFEMGDWHFIVLDSTHSVVGWGYTAQLDDEQYEWLAQLLKTIPENKHICILSHIPILSSTVFFDGNLMKNNKWSIPGAWMHKDAVKIKNLFYQHKNVKLALSGHVHLQDEVNYLGVKYLCNGAVCGAWWGGNYQEFPPALAIIDLYSDGSSKQQLINYLTV